MKKKGLVFLAAALGLVFMGQFGLIKAGPASQATAEQSAEASSLAEKQFASAVTLLKQENFSEAIAAYEKVIRLLPESPIAQDARYWIGQAYFRMGKYDEALSIFKKLLKDYPGSPIVHVAQLMVACVEQEKKNPSQSGVLNEVRDRDVIIDPATGAKYAKIAELTGKKAVVEYIPGHLFRSPNGKFLLYDNLVIPLDENEPFKLVESPDANGFACSPDGKKVSYYADGAIWISPISPETGRPAGAPKRILDYLPKYRYAVSWAPDSKKIAFEWGKDEEGGDIWTLSIEDGALKQITDDPIWEARPNWSGDGKTIAFTRDGGLYFIPAEGGTAKKILDNARPYSWSPDGECLWYHEAIKPRLYRKSDGHVFEITPPEGVGEFFSWSADGKSAFFYRSSYDYAPLAKVVSTQGGPSVQLGQGLPLWPYVHFWSPDNRMIMTGGGNLNDQELFMIPISGGKSTTIKLDISDANDFHPRSVSPDGKRLLVYIPQEKGKEDLYVSSLSLKEGRTVGSPFKVFTGRDKKPVEFGKIDEWAWSPDGTRLALVHDGDIWVASAEKDNPVRITKDPANETFPVWSPDGKNIAFIERQNIVGGVRGGQSLYVVSSSGGERQKIRDGCYKEEFTWSLDGKKIFFVSEGSIYAVALSGEKPQLVLDLKKEGLKEDLKSVQGLCWIPGGRKLAFMTSDGWTNRIFLISPSGGGLTELASDDPVMKDWIYPSPDGKWISYVTEEWVKARSSETIWEVKVEDLIKGKK
ncbi:MAG: DPP IV N-terminal domain-containing protein [Candidatus Aminicenantes bacterium]|nr:DPP IV N-terminal domain-containing protein [Candidatus Aminicenantes bacterium]